MSKYLKRFWFRASIAGFIVVILTVLVIFKFKEYDNEFIGNLWIFGSMLISACISTNQVFKLISDIRKSKERGIEKAVKICVGNCLFFFVVFFFMLGHLRESQNWVYSLLVTFVSVSALLMDSILAKFKTYKNVNRVLLLDKSLLFGVIVTTLIGLLFETVNITMASGCVAGATAFQLIITALMFDTLAYEPVK
jgi:hypothetical protein